MFDFLLAPLLSLFSAKFYRRLLSLSQGLGFLYVAYLSLLLAIGGTFLVRIQVLPQTDQFIEWMEANIPELVFTSSGLDMRVKDPVLLTHPQWGPLIYFNVGSDLPQSADLEKAAILITRTHVAYRDPRQNQYRIQSLVPGPDAQKRWQDLRVDGPTIDNFWRRLRPFMGALVFLLFFVVAFFWKLFAGLLYSLIGIAINFFRRERLAYRFILNLTFFALTPVTLIQFASWMLPGIHIPIHPLIAILITAAYVAFAVLASQQRTQPE